MKNIYYLWDQIGRGHVRLKEEPNAFSDSISFGFIKMFDQMKEIKLTQGKVALVDDEDYDYLIQWKWIASISGKTYYAQRWAGKKLKCKTIKMHRVILSAPHGQEIDHIDHNGLNNQKSNLRLCTHSQNCANKISSGESPYLGVSYTNWGWKAQICINRKVIYLGLYETQELAARAYDAKAKETHGEFANLNFK